MTSSPIRLMVDNGNAPARGGIGVYSNGLIDSLRAFGADTVSVQESPASFAAARWRSIHRLRYLWRLRQLTGSTFEGADVVHFTNS